MDTIYMAVNTHVQRLLNQRNFDGAKIVATMSPLPPLMKSLVLSRIDAELKRHKSAESAPHLQSG
jgi:hypothetical protein